MDFARSKPLISVVTVVWNNLPGLEITSASLAGQTYSKVEHVVIDGGSTDGTPEWLESYGPAYPVTKISEPDDGLYQAMNKGFGLASGELVMFLNGGDTFASNDVLEFVADRWSNEDWQWGYGGINYIDSKRQVLSHFHLLPFAPRRVQLGLTYVPHPSTFMSRELLTHLGGFRPEFGWSADQELGVRAAIREMPAVWARTFTDFLVGGAHSQGSLIDVARRYALIRSANNVPVLRSSMVDKIYTGILGRYWTMRAWTSARLKRTAGVDSVRKVDAG